MLSETTPSLGQHFQPSPNGYGGHAAGQDQPTFSCAPLSQAHLLVGPHDFLVGLTKQFLQQILCPHKGCSVCATCRQIADEQHHNVMWLKPEKQYTLESLEVIFETISFSLNPDEHHFFIIQKADSLTTACSNSLLKSVEEPPHGYHFIFLTERLDQILPTIKSRCLISSFYGESVPHAHSNILQAFTTSLPSPSAFLKMLENEKINERETIELIDQLVSHWIIQGARALADNKTLEFKKTERIIQLLSTVIKRPPMPGSAKMVWRNLYLQMLVIAH